MDPPDPIEAIKFRMEQQGLTRRDLEELIGTRTRIAEILNVKQRHGAFATGAGCGMRRLPQSPEGEIVQNHTG